MTEFFKKLGKADARNWIAVIIVIGCFAALFSLLFYPVPAGNKDVVNTIIGLLFGGALGGVIGYYFGSSKSETDKTKTDN